ncbi:hypothetical protein MYXO_00883 [Myxococcaceae bacterium]|nr:hypothetical protein MYXO_00883 [Myxococcaceae bacterium]
MDSENEQRAKRGLVLCIHRTREGKLRLVIDDVIAESDRWPQAWRSHVFVTRNEYDPERFLESQLTEAEFAEIGATAVASLAATFDRNGGAASKPR